MISRGPCVRPEWLINPNWIPRHVTKVTQHWIAAGTSTMREVAKAGKTETAVLSARDALFSSRRHCFRRNWSGATILIQTSARENLLHTAADGIRARTVIMGKPLSSADVCITLSLSATDGLYSLFAHSSSNSRAIFNSQLI